MAVREVIHVATPIVEGGNRVIASPFQFAMTGEDNLRLSVANSLVGVTVNLDGRFLDQDNKIQAFSYTFTPTADRLVTSMRIPMGRGFVLNLTSYARTGAPKIGQTFVKVDVIRGFSGATIALGTMLQGYVAANQSLGWPGSPIQSSLDGGGFIRFFNGTMPGPGAEISETVPTGARWEVLRVLAGLQASAAAANRYIRFDFYSGGFINARTGSGTPQTAGQNTIYSWGQNYPFSYDPVNLLHTQPFTLHSQLLAGQSFQTEVLNMQAGDQWSQPRTYVQEWLEVD